MTREEIYSEIESMMGFVPTFFEYMTDQYLEVEWSAWKSMKAAEEVIPAKYRALINLGIAGTAQDKYGIFYYTQSAKMAGATDEEIREVAQFAKQAVGWGPFLRINQIDFEKFKEEAVRAMQNYKERQEMKVKPAM